MNKPDNCYQLIKIMILSIIIPVYNEEKTVLKSLQSLKKFK